MGSWASGAVRPISTPQRDHTHKYCIAHMIPKSMRLQARSCERQEIVVASRFQGNAAAPPIGRCSEFLQRIMGHTLQKGVSVRRRFTPRATVAAPCRLPHRSQRNASIAIAVSIGRVTMNRCPSSIICSRAFGMSRARMRPLTGGTRSDGGIVRPSAFCGS